MTDKPNCQECEHSNHVDFCYHADQMVKGSPTRLGTRSWDDERTCPDWCPLLPLAIDPDYADDIGDLLKRVAELEAHISRLDNNADGIDEHLSAVERVARKASKRAKHNAHQADVIELLRIKGVETDALKTEVDRLKDAAEGNPDTWHGGYSRAGLVAIIERIRASVKTVDLASACETDSAQRLVQLLVSAANNRALDLDLHVGIIRRAYGTLDGAIAHDQRFELRDIESLADLVVKRYAAGRKEIDRLRKVNRENVANLDELNGAVAALTAELLAMNNTLVAIRMDKAAMMERYEALKLSNVAPLGIPEP